MPILASMAGLPRHAVDACRRASLKCAVTLLQEIDGDVMQQRGEPHTLALSRRHFAVSFAQRLCRGGAFGTKLGPRKAVLRDGFFHGFFFFSPFFSIIRALFLEWHP
jgi:hypothetical protein